MRILGAGYTPSSSDKLQETQGKPHIDGTTPDQLEWLFFGAI